MSETDNRRQQTGAGRNLAEHDRPDVWRIADEAFPDDLQPSDEGRIARPANSRTFPLRQYSGRP